MRTASTPPDTGWRSARLVLPPTEMPMKNDMATLDDVFSEYIRRRDADPLGFVQCISCGKRIRWEAADCGSLITDAPQLRFDERNRNAQCRVCHRLLNGNPTGQAQGIARRYGTETLLRLREESRPAPVPRLTRAEIAEAIRHYAARIARLKAQ